MSFQSPNIYIYKRFIKNYGPVSLLAICSKIFERLLFKDLHKCLNENDLISSNQRDFQPGDSCINQLLPITCKIYQSFDNNLGVREVILDISKVFDKVWHEELILKLSRNSIYKPVKSFQHFLKYQKQRVLLNGQHSSWSIYECYSARIYFRTSFVLDLYKWLVVWFVVQLQILYRWHAPFLCWSWCNYKFLWA